MTSLGFDVCFVFLFFTFMEVTQESSSKLQGSETNDKEPVVTLTE